MEIKELRHKKGLSQEFVAENAGVSLRTVQRAESGEVVGYKSLGALAEFYNVSIESLTTKNSHTAKSIAKEFTVKYLAQHRSMQLIIFSISFFLCISQWMAYFAYLDPGPNEANLGGIMIKIIQISAGAAIFAAIFSYAKITFVWSYYVTAALFLLTSIALEIWTQDHVASASYQLLFPVFFTLMLLALLLIHVLQLALSLKEESVVLVSNVK